MRHVYRKNKDKRRPIRAMMELTYKCNHKCIHCYNPEPSDKFELSKEETFSVIDQLADMILLGKAINVFLFMLPDASL